MAGDVMGYRRAVILTALPVEYEAVRTHLTDLDEVVHPRGTVYEEGIFRANGSQWRVVLLELGAGNSAAAFEAERAIDHFNPEIVLFVGVAGGLKDDVELGDVVAATKVYGYEAGKELDDKFLTRPSVGLSSYPLEQRARSDARRGRWLQRITGIQVEQSPKAVVAPIASGEKVVGSTKSRVYQLLQNTYNDAVAVEMEGIGFSIATHANKVDALVVRGISDQLDNKSSDNDKKWQNIAARNASAFAFEILANLRSDSSQPSSNVASPSLPREQTAQMSKVEPGESFEIFYSYAEADKEFAERLQIHLTLLKKQKLITDWYKGTMDLGHESSENIEHLNSARIILLLISPNYIVSDENYETELSRAMERHKNKEAVVVPIIIKPTDDLSDEPFGAIQPLPRDRRPISTLPAAKQEEALAEIAREIRALIKSLRKK